MAIELLKKHLFIKEGDKYQTVFYLKQASNLILVPVRQLAGAFLCKGAESSTII